MAAHDRSVTPPYGTGRLRRTWQFLRERLLTRKRLRLGRTLFVHRWHAAQTIGEWVGNDEVGQRFEHLNHVQSLSEYLWRYGAFAEAVDGSGRVPVSGCPGLKEIIAPIAASGRKHFENAVAYALLFAGDQRLGRNAGLPASPAEVVLYADRHPDVSKFAGQLLLLHRAMLDYYSQMGYLTKEECEAYRTGPMPLLSPLRGTLLRRAPRTDRTAGPAHTADDPLQSQNDLTAALRDTFTRNIRNALACRAQRELVRTLDAELLAAALRPEQPRFPFEQPPALTAPAVLDSEGPAGRRRVVVPDRALVAMLASIDEPPMPWLVQKLAAFRTAVSAMITVMPVFIVKNFFRDTLAGFVAGRYWQPPFTGTLSGSLHALRDLRTGRSALMRDYLLQGGFLLESHRVRDRFQHDPDGGWSGAGGGRGPPQMVACRPPPNQASLDRRSGYPSEPVSTGARGRRNEVFRRQSRQNGLRRLREHRRFPELENVCPHRPVLERRDSGARPALPDLPAALEPEPGWTKAEPGADAACSQDDARRMGTGGHRDGRMGLQLLR